MRAENLHEQYMTRCLDLAGLGIRDTAPNPMVGAVVVHNNRIIGEGYHRQYGGPHAEVNALNAVADKSVLKSSILYVNLEPCSHFGKTPPCADLIVSSGIPEVVIGTTDPNPLVAGKGIEKLEKAGVKVTLGVLAGECIDLNKRFLTAHILKRPYVVLKWARTSDGFIDVIRQATNPVEPTWISNDISRMLVHKWRSQEQAILTGTRTALMDNPRLNVREWPGKWPLRLVIDRQLKLPQYLHVFDNQSDTLVFNAVTEKQEGRTRYVKIGFDNLVPDMLGYLAGNGIQSVLVEGGRALLESFVQAGLWDEAFVFTGPRKFGTGVPGPEMPALNTETCYIRQDVLTHYRNIPKTKFINQLMSHFHQK